MILYYNISIFYNKMLVETNCIFKQNNIIYPTYDHKSD